MQGLVLENRMVKNFHANNSINKEKENMDKF